MKNSYKDDIALFRYGIIAPLVTGTARDEFVSNNQFFEHASKQKYKNYNDEIVSVSKSSIERWYLDYRKGGLDALKPQRRSDFGLSRKIDVDISERIMYYKEMYPRISATLIYDKLVSENIINHDDISLSTITRYIKKLNLNHKDSGKEYKRYEKENINEVWYGDTSHGPSVEINGKKYKTYIIALIDDASRMVVGSGLFLNDNTANLVSVMKTAVKKYGKPNLFSFDNGSNYKNKQMSLIVARLGSGLNHTAPYTPQSKAKIERWFRTLKDQCLSLLLPSEWIDYELVKIKIANFVDSYNNTVHTSLNRKTPQERFFSQQELIRHLDDENIENSFLFEAERKVSKDNVIHLESKEYEVDYRYCNQKILLRYSPDLSATYIVNDDESLTPISLLNKIDNSKTKRNKISLAQEDKACNHINDLD